MANDYESSVDQSDASYAYAGYAPISLRLIQAAAKSLPGAIEKRPEPAKPVELSWDGVQDVLNLVPGETFEHSIIPDSKMYKSSRNSSAAPMTLVVFVGGCTLAEVSALRTISQNERCESLFSIPLYQFIFGWYHSNLPLLLPFSQEEICGRHYWCAKWKQALELGF